MMCAWLSEQFMTKIHILQTQSKYYVLSKMPAVT